MRRVLAILALSLTAACGPTLLRGPHIAKDAEIWDTPENRDLLEVVERYRQAMERRDIAGLLSLASPNYYEQAGTSGTEDDYGFDGLSKILQQRLGKLKTLRLKLVIYRISIDGDRAEVDYTYHGRFQVQGAKRALWSQKSWEARMRMERVGGRWLILSGM
jgi:hypothetical protein